MNNLSGGYIMVDLSSPNKVKQLEKAAALNKPLLVYYEDGTTEWGKVTVTYETIDDVEVPTYHITTANGFVTVEADGDVSARPLIVEGDGTPLEKDGVTISYCKWSLSGTHLMMVCAGSIANATEIVVTDIIAKFEVPKFILDKVYPIFGGVVELKAIPLYADNYSSQSMTVQFRKETSDLRIQPTGTTTLTANRSFRMQFDLLIDNE